MDTMSATMEEVNLKDILSKTDITDAYEMKSMAELEFVEKNPELIEVLPFIEFIAKKVFRQPMKFALELLDEGEDWQTLFITGDVESEQDRIDFFSNRVFEFLFFRYPEISTKLNLDIRPR